MNCPIYSDEPIPSNQVNLEISKVKSIESIVCYLQAQYGFENFKRIYGKVTLMDGRSRGRIFFDKYTELLENYMKLDQIEKDLPLFLALSRMNGYLVVNN